MTDQQTERPCKICGRGHTRAGNIVTCSTRCAAWHAHTGIRALVDPEYREAQYLRTARRLVKRAENGEKVDDSALRHARRVVEEGVPDDGARWIVRGSATWDYAVEMVREDAPIVERWPEAVRDQVHAFVEGGDAAA